VESYGFRKQTDMVFRITNNHKVLFSSLVSLDRKMQLTDNVFLIFDEECF